MRSGRGSRPWQSHVAVFFNRPEAVLNVTQRIRWFANAECQKQPRTPSAAPLFNS
jgi:hypothetical protein